MEVLRVRLEALLSSMFQLDQIGLPGKKARDDSEKIAFLTALSKRAGRDNGISLEPREKDTY